MLHNFSSTQKLIDCVVSSMIAEFQKPGLIMLSAGKTFESDIYPEVNKYFEENPNKIHKDLLLSIVDEKVTDDENYRFYNSVTAAMPRFKKIIRPIIKTGSKINIEESVQAFDSFIKANGGPRLIYFGLGSDPQRAHVAYIAEDYLNASTEIVNLSKAEINKPDITRAITIGTDIFKSKNLEKIMVVVIGEKKAKSLSAAFENPNTGLGYLIKNYSDILNVYCDFERGLLEDLFAVFSHIE